MTTKLPTIKSEEFINVILDKIQKLFPTDFKGIQKQNKKNLPAIKKYFIN